MRKCSPNSPSDAETLRRSADQVGQRQQCEQQHPQDHRAPYQADHAAQVTQFGRRAARRTFDGMALERQAAINADHPLVREYWDLVEFLNGAQGLATK